MSASKEEKIRRDQQRREKRRQEEQADRRATALYTVVGAVVVVAAILLMVWTSGILQRNLTAAKIGGETYTAADLQYYYNSVYQKEVNNTLSSLGIYPFDTSASLKKQVYDQESGESWYDHLLDQALEALAADTALAAQAQAEGYTLSEEAQQELGQFSSSLETAWLNYNYSSRDQFIKANYGAHMSYSRLLELVRQQVLASDYASAQVSAIQHSDADYESYYKDNADMLDTISYSQFAFQAQVPATDAEGDAPEMTEDEKAAALAEAKAEQQALAEELKAKLEAGGDPAALAEEYADQLYSSALDRRSTGANLSYSSYADWILDSARTAGDITLSDYDSGTAHYYYVVLFQSRQRDDTPTANVRHILVAAEQDEGASEPTQAQYDAAYAQAEELLEQWKAGAATEESFTELAKEHSADPGVTSNDGLYTNISRSSSLVDTFKDWALDAGRKVGDTGIVQNTGSSTKGWHIMYYAGSNDPVWKQTAAAVLADQDYDSLVAQISEGQSVTTGMGLSLISA